MCAIDDADPADVYVGYSRKARKPHRCDECHRTIAVGETYGYAKMLFSGFWSEFRTCSHCAIGQKWLSKNCGGYLHAGLSEEIDEHLSEYGARFPGMAFGLLRLKWGMTNRWSRKGSLMPIPHLPANIEVRP